MIHGAIASSRACFCWLRFAIAIHVGRFHGTSLKMPINDGAGGADREEYAFIFGNCEEFRQLFNDSLTYLFQGER